SAASAQGPDAPREYLPEEPMLTRRRSELMLTVVTHVTTIDAPGRAGELHQRTGGGVDGVPFIFREPQWLRLGPYVNLTGGRWGDTEHGGLITEGGLKLRTSLLAGSLVDLYPLLGAGVMYGTRDGGHWGLTPHIGFGGRILNAFVAELSVEHDIALGP